MRSPTPGMRDGFASIEHQETTPSAQLIPMPSATTFAETPVDDSLVVACKGAAWTDSVSRALLTLLLQNAGPKDLAGCAIYLFQTTRPHLRKYGISADPAERAMSARRRRTEKNRYSNLLYENWCESRLQAICFEGALGEAVGTMRYTDDDKAELGFCTELTQASADEVEAYIALFHEDWAAKGGLGFIAVNCREKINGLLRLAERLRSGKAFLALDTSMNNRTCFVDDSAAGGRFTALLLSDAIKHLGLEGWNDQ
jgi:hypothetical protein